MVMEVPPSPDSVGREFVRQYYTLLNKAPTHLHRFYNNQSSFVHGGIDPPQRETLPMIGQKQIHQKIQQLNFQDCHAKITQVDAQATLGNGVVVQVTGELSNAGQPMRRFTQTFVLAAQSPKKYYVHNDIFRYQDEIISDEECENETRSGDEADINQELQPLNQPNLANYYNPNTAPIPQVPQHHQHVMQPPPQQPIPTVNGAVHQDEIMPGTLPPHISSTPTLQPPNPPTPIIKNEVPIVNPTVVEEIQAPLNPEEGAGDALEKNKYMEATIAMKPEPEPVSEPISNEPKTYATLLKSGSGGYPIPIPPAKSVSPPPMPKMESRDRDGQVFQSNVSRISRGPDNRMARPNQPPRPRPEMRNNVPRGGMEDGGEERRRSQVFNDSNQLFLGNLPLTATEDDLRELFEKFGPIADLRIHSKVNKTGPPGARAPPNYGFITFESQQGVQACLAAKPIYLPGNDKTGGTLLNVEEKKIKDRPSFGGNMRNNQGDNLSPRPPRDNNGPRRGPMVGGGPPRDRERGPMGGGPGNAGGGLNSGNRPNNFSQRGATTRAGPNNNAYPRR